LPFTVFNCDIMKCRSCLLLCARRFVVGCMEFDWVVGWVGLWVQNFRFAMGWVGSVVWWVGLVWVKEIGPTDVYDRYAAARNRPNPNPQRNREQKCAENDSK